MYVLDKEVECFHCQGCPLYILRNGRGYKENVSSPKNVFVTKKSIVDRKWYPLMVWWYTKQTIKNMKIYTWQLLIHAFDGHWYQFERFSWNITRHLLCEIYIISPGIKKGKSFGPIFAVLPRKPHILLLIDLCFCLLIVFRSTWCTLHWWTMFSFSLCLFSCWCSL